MSVASFLPGPTFLRVAFSRLHTLPHISGEIASSLNASTASMHYAHSCSSCRLSPTSIFLTNTSHSIQFNKCFTLDRSYLPNYMKSTNQIKAKYCTAIVLPSQCINMSGIRLKLTGKRWQAIFTIRSHSIGYQTISYASKSHPNQTINTLFLGLKSNLRCIKQ